MHFTNVAINLALVGFHFLHPIVTLSALLAMVMPLPSLALLR